MANMLRWRQCRRSIKPEMPLQFSEAVSDHGPIMNDMSLLIVNPLLEVADFDSDAACPMMLCVLPRADGEGDVRFAVPSNYLDLARQFDGTRSVDDAIWAYIECRKPSHDVDWLRRLVVQSLMPRGILIRRDQDARTAATSAQSTKAFLHVKLPIIKASIVAPVARRLSFLFHLPVMWAGFFVFIAIHVYVYAVLFRGSHFEFNRLAVGSIVLLMLISTLATLCHEFGHASAASHFGCRDMTIGWGLYLIYAVLWTNVSDAWKLPRQQRAIIDLGGVYFESFFLLALIGAYLGTKHPIFLFGFIFVDLSIANTFNPFLRMDGYWLVSDLFGIVNLRKQQEVWWQDLAGRLAHRKGYVPRSTLSRRARWVLGAYTIAGTLFIAFVLKTMFQLVALSVLRNLPDFIEETIRHVSSTPTLASVVRAVLEMGWRVLLVIGTVMTFWNVARAVFSMVRRLRVAEQPVGGAI